MPYIKQEDRKDLSYDGISPKNSGQLNYLLTQIILIYLDNIREYIPNFGTNPGKYLANTYSDYNAVMGVLECIKQELYRRLVVPYENKKITENGDVYND